MKPSTVVRGVALIEIMVAVLLVSFGLLGLISLLGRSTQFAVAEDSQRAPYWPARWPARCGAPTPRLWMP
ncbi:hypothetical protein ACVBEH_12330 [Roseateles sp. GG27B]